MKCSSTSPGVRLMSDDGEPAEPVSGLIPFVQRSEDGPVPAEELGGVADEPSKPRSDGGQTRWGAAKHAEQRLD